MSYKKFINFSQRNLLYTDSAGGGRGPSGPPGYAPGVKVEMALRSRRSMKIFAITGEMQESMGIPKT